MEKIEKLPLAEETVMLALWNLEEPATAAAVAQYLQEETHWSLTTVCSFLTLPIWLTLGDFLVCPIMGE